MLSKEERLERKINDIKSNVKLSQDKNRKRLFKLNALPIKEAIKANDYKLFSKYKNGEQTRIHFFDLVKLKCSEVKFYNYVASNSNKYDSSCALDILMKNDELNKRYDIISILLSKGAVYNNDNIATNLLKQNVELAKKHKSNKNKPIKIAKSITKRKLIRQANWGRLDEAVVNLTKVLEESLKQRIDSDMPLLEMIDTAADRGMIENKDQKQMHNLRRARNNIVHSKNQEIYYTKENVLNWIDIVYKKIV